MSEVSIKADKMGKAYVVSNKRCGITECIFLTADELRTLQAEMRGYYHDVSQPVIQRIAVI